MKPTKSFRHLSPDQLRAVVLSFNQAPCGAVLMGQNYHKSFQSERIPMLAGEGEIAECGWFDFTHHLDRLIFPDENREMHRSATYVLSLQWKGISRQIPFRMFSLRDVHYRIEEWNRSASVFTPEYMMKPLFAVPWGAPAPRLQGKPPRIVRVRDKEKK